MADAASLAQLGERDRCVPARAVDDWLTEPRRNATKRGKRDVQAPPAEG
jgi:hypothetical protein